MKNISNIYNFSREEKKLRMRWLVSTLLITVGFGFFSTFASVIGGFWVPQEDFTDLAKVSVFSTILIHCTFIKGGYRYLCMSLAVTSLVVLKNIFSEFSGGLLDHSDGVELFILIYGSIAWWIVESFKIARLHKRVDEELSEKIKDKKNIESEACN